VRTGIIILCIFAAIWAIAGIAVEHMPLVWAALPLAVSAAILLWAARQPPDGEPGPHVGRLVGVWSGVESVAMFLAANFLIKNHLADAVMPAFAIIVGLHFLPLARGIPLRLYYATGPALVLVGVAGLLAPLGALVIGGMAAVIMWASAVALAKGVR
jgi:hypothetical protein